LELRAWEKLELAVALERLGLPSPLTPAAAFARTWLAQRPEAWALTPRIGYQVTHAVFHVTDFGARPERLPPDTRAYLADWLPVWMAYAARLEHLDLLAEFVMATALSGLEDGVDDALATLLNGLTADFANPGKRAAKAFAERYHLVLVSLMAGLAATRLGA
jgi:hypothetical protein